MLAMLAGKQQLCLGTYPETKVLEPQILHALPENVFISLGCPLRRMKYVASDSRRGAYG